MESHKPFCPAAKKKPHLVQRMSMSTIGFVAHALRPSIPKESKKELGSEEQPRTVTGNTYSIFTTKNYGDNEMHWFWMVLVYQHVGQRVSQRERLPPNSLHRLLPEDWGQGKRTRAINRYKKDLSHAEEELQQLHFNEQPG